MSAVGVLLARTLLHDPMVLVLDEPASDLDPRARIELRVPLQQIRALGKTILLSSHVTPRRSRDARRPHTALLTAGVCAAALAVVLGRRRSATMSPAPEPR
jgi:ABC-type Mn2+/Zn2+ transport system ATPase subunit